MNLPSVDRVIIPSEVAVPEAVSGRFESLSAVGMATLCTSVPLGAYSSRNTSVAALESVAVPVPTL